MTDEGDVNAASTTNVRLDGGKKNRKGKKHQKVSDDDHGEEPIDVTPGEEWIARVETARQAVEILGRLLNVADGKFKTLEDFILEEIDNIRKEIEGRQHAEFEMKEAITSLECRLMEALSTIETMKTEMKALKEDRGKVEEQRPHPKNHDIYMSDGKKFGRHGDTEKKAETAKRNGCYICGGSHDYARCPELKSLGAILRERKKKDAQDQGQGTKMTQLGLIGQCGAITK
uniref:Uncharacterized protein n=1 Tax=Solanum tuberosum TaxID=4113 RepID=M1B5P3_SOLTU